jgi:CelD/BcsL family acetyltransferase involved in cellulose biosynthesis
MAATVAAYDIVTIDTEAELVGIKPAWEALCASAEDVKPFAAFPWIWNSWRWDGGGKALAVLTAWSGDELVAAVPLCSYPRFGTTVFQYIHFLPYGYVGPVVHREHPEAASVLGAYVSKRHPRSLLYVSDMPEDDTHGRRFFEAFVEAGHCVRTWLRPVSHELDWKGTFEEYLATKTSKSRANLRRAWRKLEGRGPVDVVCLSGSGVDAVLMERLSLVQRRSWMVRRHAAHLGELFWANLIPDLARQGLAEVWILSVAGDDLAYVITLLSRSRVHYFNTAFDFSYASYSPGALLLSRCIENAFNRGFSAFDFLQGDAWYKRFWGNSSRNVLRAVAYRGVSGWVCSWAPFRWHEWFTRHPHARAFTRLGLGFGRRRGAGVKGFLGF